MRYCFLLLLTTILINSCKNDYLSNYGLVRTGEVTDMDAFGARFNAIVTNTNADDIIDHGFVWGLTRQPVLSGVSPFKVSLGNLSGKKTFSSFISSDLLETGAITYIRAYLKTNKYISYGPQVMFTYNKEDKTPVILKTFPDSLFWGTDLDISGRNFSFIPNNISVRMRLFTGDNGFRNLPITECSKTSISTLLIGSLGKTDIGKSSELYVTVNNHESIKVPVYFKAPEISLLSSTSGFISNSTFIYGTNLGHSFVDYEVTLGGVNCPIQASGNGFLKVQIPDSPVSGLKPLRVKFQGMATTKENAYNVIPPEITSFTPATGTALSFMRVNFINAPTGYKMYFGNTQVNPLPSSGTNYINFYVPNLPPGDYEIKICYYSLFHIAVDKYRII